jgi:NAD(P)-dependent dehydrogenase (short-subunit alcohol dehydrogenase family)
MSEPYLSRMGLAGRVVIVAGEGERIEQVTASLLAGDALVALVTVTAAMTDAHAWFRVDPNDPSVWDRVVPHVEQRLGPIDAAVTTAGLHAQLTELLEPDMLRRGHGGVVDVDAARDVDDALRQLATLL